MPSPSPGAPSFRSPSTGAVGLRAGSSLPQHSHMAARGALERIAVLPSTQSFGYAWGLKRIAAVFLNTVIWLHFGV